jgi:muramoyltetrapeptide carboxypeptidase
MRNWLAGIPPEARKERASDFNDFIRDADVRAILSFIGGNHSNQILNLIDYNSLAKDPKVIMGYSDMTVPLLAINKICGMITFYGPAILTQFAEYPKPLDYTMKYFKRAVMSVEPAYNIEPSTEWTQEVLDWVKKEDTRPRRMQKNNGCRSLKNGKAKGRLLGGCITSLMHLRETKFWPNFNGSIFFWETPEGNDIREGESLENVDAYLADLELSGVFDKISGMLVGRPYAYSEGQKSEFQSLLSDRLKKYNWPLIMDLDFGHTDPFFTIPIGAMAEIDASRSMLKILDNSVE